MPTRLALPRHIANPVTGDRIEVLTSPLSGEAGPLVFRTTLAPGAKGSPLHRHGRISETFTVEDGELVFLTSDRQEQVMERGAQIHVPAGTPHGFCNPGDAPTTFLTQATPGDGFEKFLRVMFGLAEQNRTTVDGMPTDPRALGLALSYADLVLEGAPASVQRAAIGGLAWLGAVMGVEAALHRLIGADATFSSTLAEGV